MRPIPITVFTGFVGAGKTTIILSLLKRLPVGYKVVLLKNEFGDVKVDSELARESNVQVTEMLNGCLCCVLVGQMANALNEIRETQNPDRIIIETSGSAFPAPIAWQIRQLSNSFSLDAIVTVVDCVNFRGYEDTSYTARLQAQYSDLILLNKHELVTERQLDDVIDRVNDLNTDTVKVHVDADKGIAPDLVFGIDSKLFELSDRASDERKWAAMIDPAHMQSDVQVATIEGRTAESSSSASQSCNGKDHTLDCSCNGGHSTAASKFIAASPITREALATLFEPIPADTVYRIKGFVLLAPTLPATDSPQLHIVNWAFGRMELTPVRRVDPAHAGVGVLLTVMGQFGMKTWVGKIKDVLLSDIIDK
ncbi:CobW/HypB/UreG, nucleotide-binding domain-containing protein [Geranomyces variabilis]|nr:CobW/HypB/UreG, nucleotide-binding domain-containing protein [Geranomyces variabilis]